uniref:RNA helicase n=1 Tax=Globodera pallida TaxID=36090 RepID=A0A183CGL5_GLOPA
MGIQSVMEYYKQDYYKKLAELRMEKPKKASLNDEAFTELLEFYEKVQTSLMGSEYDPLEKYVEKFRHFVHLFFAEEKLDLEGRFKEDINVQYIGHRSASNKAKKGKYASAYAVYVFMLPAQKIEDLILYQTISIDGIKGKITHINRGSSRIEVAFEDKKGQLKFDENISYCLDIEFNERQYEAFMDSIYLVEKKGRADFVVFPNSSELIPGDEFAKRLIEFKRSARNDPDLMRFDEQQQLAIFSIVNGIHGTVPFVLWGPPGTGKTVTLVECVRQLMQRDDSLRILICTPSNTAADLIARRIMATTKLSRAQIRRYYSLGKNVDDRDQELDEIIKMENCAFYGLYDDRFKIDDYDTLLRQNVRLIFTTLACSSYLSKEIQEPDFFSHIFIDEAGQSIEPETLIPITRFATRNTRIVLCGDHQQLGPVVKANFLKRFKSCHFSLMERLMVTMRTECTDLEPEGAQNVYTDGRTFCQLTASYRCHPKIIQFSSDHFYAGTLCAVNEENRKSFCDWKHLPSKNFPIIFHALTKGAEVRQFEGSSYHNEEEVEVVLKYIKMLRETTNIEDEDIGVISPYKQQTQKIRQCLSGSRKITVDSVECYQGSERRVIILTLSRSKQIGFLAEYKRLNTSLTRAKELIIVVASLDFVRNLHPNRSPHNYWRDFVNYCVANNAVLVDGFAGNLDFNDQILAQNLVLIRRCLKETVYSENILRRTPQLRSQKMRTKAPSAICRRFRARAMKKVDGFGLNKSHLEEGEVSVVNAVNSLMVNNSTDAIEYEDLTGSPGWREEDESGCYDVWRSLPSPKDTYSEASKQSSSLNFSDAAVRCDAKIKRVTAKRRVNHPKKTNRIPEDAVRDQPRLYFNKAQTNDITAEIATSVEEDSLRTGSGDALLRDNHEQNCRIM